MPDPDGMLAQMRLSIRTWERSEPLSREEHEAAENIGRVAAELDDWLSHGGALPEAWQDARHPMAEGVKPMPLTDDLILNMAANVLEKMRKPNMAGDLRGLRPEAEGKIGGNPYTEPVGRWGPGFRMPIPLGGGNSGPGGPPDLQSGRSPHVESFPEPQGRHHGYPGPTSGKPVTGEDVLMSLAGAAQSITRSAAEILSIGARRLAGMREVRDDEVVVRRDDLETLLIHEQDERDGAPHPGNWEQVLRESTVRLNAAMRE